MNEIEDLVMDRYAETQLQNINSSRGAQVAPEHANATNRP
jgi:hypothetical protein